MKAAIIFLLSFGFALSGMSQPESLHDLRSLLKDAASTTREIKKTDSIINRINEQGWDLKARIEVHNSYFPDGQCTYEEGHPEQCDWWVNEGNQLNQEADYLIGQSDYQELQLKFLKTHLQIIMAAIRINQFLSSLNCQCPEIIPEAEVQCYIQCWDNGYDPGFTVPDPPED